MIFKAIFPFLKMEAMEDVWPICQQCFDVFKSILVFELKTTY